MTVEHSNHKTADPRLGIYIHSNLEIGCLYMYMKHPKIQGYSSFMTNAGTTCTVGLDSWICRLYD